MEKREIEKGKPMYEIEIKSIEHKLQYRFFRFQEERKLKKRLKLLRRERRVLENGLGENHFLGPNGN